MVIIIITVPTTITTPILKSRDSAEQFQALGVECRCPWKAAPPEVLTSDPLLPPDLGARGPTIPHQL